MKKEYWFVPSIFYLGFLSCIFLNACSLMDMDRPLPPTKVLWKKKGVSDEQKISDLKKCFEISTQSRANEDLNDFDKCMLKRGYKFVPKPEGWRNYCALFPERLSCKSASGEIKIQPDE